MMFVVFHEELSVNELMNELTEPFKIFLNFEYELKSQFFFQFHNKISHTIMTFPHYFVHFLMNNLVFFQPKHP